MNKRLETLHHNTRVIGMSAKPGVRADFEEALSKLAARDGVEAMRPEGTKAGPRPLEYPSQRVPPACCQL